MKRISLIAYAITVVLITGCYEENQRTQLFPMKEMERVTNQMLGYQSWIAPPNQSLVADSYTDFDSAAYGPPRYYSLEGTIPYDVQYVPSRAMTEVKKAYLVPYMESTKVPKMPSYRVTPRGDGFPEWKVMVLIPVFRGHDLYPEN